MNTKYWVSTGVTFVVVMMLGFLVHGVMLHGDYAKLPNLMRPEDDAQKLFHFMLLAHLIMAAGIVWIYTKGREAGKPWFPQGIRYGIALAAVMVLPMYLIYYTVMPFPSDLVAQQIVFDSISMVIAALVVAWLYR